MPEFLLAILFVVLLVTNMIFGKNSGGLCRIIACAGLLLVMQRDYQQNELLLAAGHPNGLFIFTWMLLLTTKAVSFKLLIDGLAILLFLYFLWDERLNNHSKGLADLYTIAVGALFGMHLMVMAANLLSIYLSIEMVSIASYLMVAYRAESRLSAEAGLKYVLFGAAASALMLYGISLLYVMGGSLNLFTGGLLAGLAQVNPAFVSIALLLVLIGIGFKLSFVPVHFWAPDVYEGAPAPVTAWLSALPKIAGFALLINFVWPFIYYTKWTAFDFRFFLAIVGMVTMVAGNFAAVWQSNVKRMLAYSSIGHTGFLMMAVISFSPAGFTALLFYLAVYALANIAAFALATYFKNIAGIVDIEGYRGLGYKFAAPSVCFIIVLVSLTGLPVTAGFYGKLLVFSSAYGFYQQNHNVLLLLMMITGAVTTVVSLFYYIKIPLNLFLRRSEKTMNPVKKPDIIVIFSVIICFLIVLLGLWPNILTNWL